MKEEIHEYELIPFGHNFADAMTRRYRMFRFTEKEAHEYNQQYASNNVKKRLVKVEGRDLRHE
tara:strand:+ start:100 stop:288 length:189 start_codon:yes stop_codon:yes gene_type:complete